MPVDPLGKYGDLPKQDNLETALKLAREKMARLDPAGQAARCGAELHPDESGGRLQVRYLGREYLVALPALDVTNVEDGRPLNLWESILVLHYLTSDGPVPLRAEVMAFTEIPDARLYEEPFRRRAVLPLLRAFGEAPEKLTNAALAFNPGPGLGGDVSVRITALPKVPIYIQLWGADEEFPPAGKILFNSDVTAYLAAEDVVTLAGISAGRLAKAAV